jgi:DNA-binding transcriptional LysR family regulator
MEIYQLKSFVTVARHANITRAAQTLHLTQSTVSGHIKALETDLGTPLFVRTAAGVELTGFGRHLLQSAQELLTKAEEIIRDAHSVAGKLTGPIRLCVINDAETLRLPAIMSGMREQYPDVTVVIRHGLSGWALKELKTAQCDAGFFIGELVDPEVKAIDLKQIEYCIVGPVAWQERVAASGWATIGSLPWIWVSPLGSYPRLVTELLSRQGITPTKVIEADREATLQSLVTAGVGLALLRVDRARVAAAEGKLFIWEQGRTSAKLSLIYLAARESDPLIHGLVSVVEKCFPQP